MRHDSTSVLTFDQPLWWKAKMILTSKPAASRTRLMVLCFGPFHMEMSFLECIGRGMEGSGLQEILKLAYAPNAVVCMMQGNAVSAFKKESYRK
ncbi:hypothetical protein ElyMa_006432300 [Elysia marginata]|uniref:Uncharacterized protein n=1 Tax=Elysia marginata TaxID=1093978 RepID=A0AAV4HYS0_9GAST|nr:hypothetical protein ElyMa_006432300 [Elysia marginata]